MKQGLSLKVSQHLALTPQLQQSIRLLQLSTLELSSEVEQMLDENPFLELDDDQAPREEFGLTRADTRVSEGDRASESALDSGAGGGDEAGAEGASDSDFPGQEGWEGDGSVEVTPDDGEWGGEAPARLSGASDGDDELDPGERPAPQESLTEHLHRQALSLRLTPEDMAALRFLIESLNDDGYLEDSLAQLAATLTDADDDLEQLEELVHRFTMALKLLQSLEPAGVGARDLAECLTLQLKSLRDDAGDDEERQHTIATALAVCAQHGAMESLAKRDAKRLAQATGTSEDDVRAAMQLISRLEPKPGRRFADVERNVVVPDVIVSMVGGGSQPRFRVQLNPDVMPRLRVHDIYANALRGGKGGENHQALVQRLQEARWFIKSLQSRNDTLLRVASRIVDFQRNFFEYGEEAMKPLVLRDIAEALEMHESTISRVTTQKYMHTPRGTYEFKFFFSSHVSTASGGEASATAIRALIKKLVGAEKPNKPLSDNKIAAILADQGINVARRTVAKYRESMAIPPSNERKRLA